MTATKNSILDRISSLLAEKGYDVSEQGSNVLRIREVTSGIAIQAVLEGEILFLTLNCLTVPEAAVTPEVMRRMLDAENGVSTSSFQLYHAGDGKLAITLNNFCKLQGLEQDDQDDILSCVQFLLVDVIQARGLIGGLLR